MFKDKERQREYQRLWKATRRAKYIEKCGGKCVRCGSNENLEFHHRDRSQKIDHKIWSWRYERIETELAKCDLLCCECHKKETAKERGYKNYVHGTLTCYKAGKCRCEKCRAANADNKWHWKYARQQLGVQQLDARGSTSPGPPQQVIAAAGSGYLTRVEGSRLPAMTGLT